jgi:catechol-2,3-dioxygenase
MPKLNRVLEAALYVADLNRAAAFYGQILGLPCIYEDYRMRTYDVGGNGVLLLFPQGGSLQPIETMAGQSHLMTAEVPCTSPFQSRRMSLRSGSNI